MLDTSDRLQGGCSRITRVGSLYQLSFRHFSNLDFMCVVLCMMMEDFVKPSIQTMMVGGTVNLVGRSVHKHCFSYRKKLKLSLQVCLFIFLVSIHVNALLFSYS